MNPTNHATVVDASVAVKWVITAEELSNQAQTLLEQSLRAHRPLFAPPHFMTEVTNVIYQRQRSQDSRIRITQEEAEEALAQFLDIPIQLASPTGLYQEAFAFARQHRLPNVYDSLYVILAHLLQAELWTADEKLINRVRSIAPWVRWIGDYPLP